MSLEDNRSRPVTTPHTRVLTGRIKVHPVGYGFVVPDDKSEDVHVSGRNRGVAMDADTVEIEAWMGVRGVEGRVIRVIARGRAKITGQLTRAGKHLTLQPDDPRITGPVSLRGHVASTLVGQAVVAEITSYPEVPDGPLEVEVLKVLGDPDDPRTEVEKVLACADVSEEFPELVARIADGLPQEVLPQDRADRADLRDVPFTTIDPESARDFDDAVAIEPLPHGGTRLWVAVADVSHYVREGAPIDDEARRRGCSIYLPSRAIPMLPEPLSARMCSLVPDEDRLAMVVQMDLDKQGKVVAKDFFAAVIHSRARLDYPGVAAALAGDTRGKRKKYEPFLPDLRAMDSLARQMRQHRVQRGALNFDLPEPVVELDHDDPRLVRDIRKSRRDPGERQAYSMIEEFMLAANESVAASFHERNEDAVWRIHDAPDRARMEEFTVLAEHYGISIDVDDARTPKGLLRVLERLKGHPAEKALSFQILRSLKQATYDVVNIGHFGLASADYLHFTSPIRRYPDLMVHRLLKTRLAGLGKPSGGWKPPSEAPPPERAALQKMAADASFAERQAMEVEREVVDLYRAFFLRDRIGDVFDGTISGVTGFGVFVVIDEPFVEGLVRLEALSDDYYIYDEPTARLVGRRSGRAFALGDAMKVEVQSVSVVRRKIDFALHQHRENERRVGDRRRGDGRGHGRSEAVVAGERRAGRDRRRTKHADTHADRRERERSVRKGRGGKAKGQAGGPTAAHSGAKDRPHRKGPAGKLGGKRGGRHRR
ncbi:MAG TPA: ribonuclease R [Polyangia bacterium]|nr:ribonuclease R [Polyangia bacterium]